MVEDGRTREGIRHLGDRLAKERASMVSRASVSLRCPYSRARQLSRKQGAGVCWLVVAARIREGESAQRSFHQSWLADWVTTRVCGRGQDSWRSVQRPAVCCGGLWRRGLVCGLW